MLRAAGAPASSGRASARPTTPRRSSVWQACAPGWLRKGRWGWGRTFRPRASPSRPSHPRRGSHRPIEDLLSVPGLRCPPDDCGEIPVAWRTTQSSIGKYVLGGDAGDDNTTGGTPTEKKLRLRTAPGRKVGARARHPRTSVSPPPTSRAARAASARRASALRGARAPGIATGVAITDGAAGLT